MWADKVVEIDSLVQGKHYKQAVQECGSILEELLREIFQRAVNGLPAGEHKEVSTKLEEIGKGKSIAQLTLGQLVGLFRETHLFEKAEKVLGRKLPHLRVTSFNTFVDIRNKAIHQGEKVSAKEAKLFAAQVGLFIDELESAEPNREQRELKSGPQKLAPWIDVVALHSDVLSENFSEDIFALDLGPLADGNRSVPAVYREPEHFFQVSYITAGLRSLLNDALSRLTGKAGNRVLKLVTPFGGGKSHTLAALYHCARNREALDSIPEGKELPRPGKVRTAVFDGQLFDATTGKTIASEKLQARTIWGWIAGSLGGKQGYELLRAQDEARVARGETKFWNFWGMSRI